MAGLIQILIYLLGVYLIYKGIEIFQIALMSNREDRFWGLFIGVIAIIASIALASSFALWADQQATVISRLNPY